MFPGLIQHSVANLPPIPIGFNNARFEINSTSFVGDVVARQLED